MLQKLTHTLDNDNKNIAITIIKDNVENIHR